MSSKTVLCVANEEGILFPKPNGNIIVTLSKTLGINQEPPTGTVSWFNKVQAFVIFDITGQNVVGISLTDMGLNAGITQASVENVLPYF